MATQARAEPNPVRSRILDSAGHAPQISHSLLIAKLLASLSYTSMANVKIRELRRILGQTQDAFAQTIGASKDTVASWETDRNRLSARMARRIALVTGVDERSLLKPGPLVTREPARRPFTVEEFRRHQKSFWGGSAQESVAGHVRRCAAELEALFRAAAQSPKGTGQLAGLLGDFHQWCEQVREDGLPAAD